MHSKGLATSAVSRSSVFQIHFFGLSKLVAVKSPAPECGRYALQYKYNIHMIVKKYYIYTARFIILILCLYLLYIFLPFDLDIESSVQSYPLYNNDDWLFHLLGVEWAIHAIIIFFLGILIWHNIFINVILGRNFFFGKFPRIILLKCFDYFWYTVGFISLLVTLIGLNAQEARLQWKYHATEKQRSWKTLSKDFKNYKAPCNIIINLPDNSEPKQDVLFFKKVCSAFDEKRNFSKIRKMCQSYESNAWGTTEGYAFYHSDNRPDNVTDALNFVDQICNTFQYIENEDKSISIYRQASNRIFSSPKKRNPAILIFFPLFVALRLVKTSSELVEAIKSHKKIKYK